MEKFTLLRHAVSSLVLLSATSVAGIAIDSTRIIFQAADDTTGKSVGITSSSGSLTPYLIKAQILKTPAGEQADTPFLVTPSLFRLEPGSTNQVRIMKKIPHCRRTKNRYFICVPLRHRRVKKTIHSRKTISAAPYRFHPAILSNYFTVLPG